MKGKATGHQHLVGLHIAEMKDGELYRGKLVLGLMMKTWRQLHPWLKKTQAHTEETGWRQSADDESKWVEPKYFVEVTYLSLTPDEKL